MNYLVVITALEKSNFTNRIEPCFPNNQSSPGFPAEFYSMVQAPEAAHADFPMKKDLKVAPALCWRHWCGSAFVFHETRTFNFLKLSIQLFSPSFVQNSFETEIKHGR